MVTAYRRLIARIDAALCKCPRCAYKAAGKLEQADA